MNLLNVPKLNYLNIAIDGTFRRTNNIWSTPEDVDALISHIRESKKKKLLIHFHGGLNSEGSGWNRANVQLPSYSASLSSDTHILFVLWETGFFDALPGAFKTYLTEEALEKIAKKVFKVIGKRYGAEFANSMIDPSVEEIKQSEVNKLSDDGLNDYLNDFKGSNDSEIEAKARLEADEVVGDEEFTTQEFEAIRSISSDKSVDVTSIKLVLFVTKVLARVVKRFLNHRGHGTWDTIIEETLREIGISTAGIHVWGQMKRQAEIMWNDNSGKKANDPTQYAGRYLIDELAKLKGEIEISVAGHSAGSVAICRLVEKIATTPQLNHIKLSNIVFMAPACRTQLFHNTVMRYPQFYKRFRMFTMNDILESQDDLINKTILKKFYGRSLLYLVSGILEDHEGSSEFAPEYEGDIHILGLHRHIRNEHPYKQDIILANIHTFLKSNQRIVLSRTDESIPGMECDGDDHGGFDGTDLMIKSVVYMMSETV